MSYSAAKTKAKSRRRRLTRQEVKALQDGEELHEAVETDPVYMEVKDSWAHRLFPIADFFTCFCPFQTPNSRMQKLRKWLCGK